MVGVSYAALRGEAPVQDDQTLLPLIWTNDNIIDRNTAQGGVVGRVDSGLGYSGVVRVWF